MIPEIKKILYATDFSENSSLAFLYAIQMAQGLGAKIVILHAVPRVPADAAAGPGKIDAHGFPEKARPNARQEDKEVIENRVQEFCQKMEGQVGPSCSILISKIHVSFGDPVNEILKAAEEEGCDAIILGNHGKGFMPQTFLGSVSSGVLHRSLKPVFMIPLPLGIGKKANA